MSLPSLSGNVLVKQTETNAKQTQLPKKGTKVSQIVNKLLVNSQSSSQSQTKFSPNKVVSQTNLSGSKLVQPPAEKKNTPILTKFSQGTSQVQTTSKIAQSPPLKINETSLAPKEFSSSPKLANSPISKKNKSEIVESIRKNFNLSLPLKKMVSQLKENSSKESFEKSETRIRNRSASFYIKNQQTPLEKLQELRLYFSGVQQKEKELGEKEKGKENKIQIIEGNETLQTLRKEALDSAEKAWEADYKNSDDEVEVAVLLCYLLIKTDNETSPKNDNRVISIANKMLVKEIKDSEKKLHLICSLALAYASIGNDVKALEWANTGLDLKVDNKVFNANEMLTDLKNGYETIN